MLEQQQPEVVIVGADGKEHVFPAGFDPKRAAEIVRQQASGSMPTWEQVASGAKNLAIGVGKGVIDTGSHLSNLAATHGLIPGVTPDMAAARFGKDQAAVEASGTAQTIGKAAEQIGEFFIPGAKAEEAAAWITSKLAPHLAQAPGAVRAMLNLLPKMATQGAAASAVTTAQGGNPVAGAVMGASGPVIGKTTETLAPILRNAAKKGVAKFEDATTKVLKAESRRTEQGVLDRGILGTQQMVATRAGRETARAGTAVRSAESAMAAANPGAVIPKQFVVDELDNIIRRNSRVGVNGQAMAREGKQDLIKAAEERKAYLDTYGDRLTFDEAADLKRDYQAMARKGKAFMPDEPTVARAEVARKAGTAMRREILKVQGPEDLEKVWATYGFWSGLEDVMKATLERTRPHKQWGKKVLAGLAMTATSGGAGAATGHTPEALIGTGIVGGIAMAVQSPTWKLASAQLKNGLADAITSGSGARVQFYLNRIAAAGVSQATKTTVPAR